MFLRKYITIPIILCILLTIMLGCWDNGEHKKTQPTISQEASANTNGNVSKNNTQGSPQTDEVVIIYGGELLGELEPCGCSGSKLGGTLLRSGWLHYLKTQHPNAILIDGGFASKKWELQDQIKFQAHYDVLQIFGYSLQFISSKDNIPSSLKNIPIFIGRGRTDFSWYRVQIIAKTTILFLAIESGNLPSRTELSNVIEKNKPQLIWVMTKNIFTDYPSIIPEGNYLTIILPVDSQAPFSLSKINEKMAIVSAGNRGRYIGIMKFHPSADMATLQLEEHVTNQFLALEKKFEEHPKAVAILDKYKQDLQDKHLLELQIKRSSPIGFIGSDACQACHIYEYSHWKNNPHAKAFHTLEVEKHHYDPECVGCHTVGFEFEEGFRTLEETPNLIDVGCESCHGAGVQHLMKPTKDYGKTDGANTCLVCHEKDRSPTFDYAKFLEKIKHWRD